MKLLDANLPLYAVDEASPFHKQMRRWFEECLSATETVAFDWNVLLAFLRLSTRAGIFAHPLTAAQAFDLIDSWLDRSNVIILQPTARHAAILRELVAPLGTAGNLTSDAHLAALSLEHGADLYSLDSDYARFSGVRWINPLHS